MTTAFGLGGQHRTRRDDKGSSLMVVIMTMFIGIVVVAGLLGFAGQVLRGRPSIEARTRGAESVRSAVRTAMTMQRDTGTVDCFAANQTMTFNAIPVNVTCETLRVDASNKFRYGVIITSNNATTTNLKAIGQSSNELLGSVFLNAGVLNADTSKVVMQRGDLTLSSAASGSMVGARYSLGATALPCTDPTIVASETYPKNVAGPFGGTSTHTTSCTAQPWWAFAGDRNAAGVWSPSYLPPVPAYTRNRFTGTVGLFCRVYFPGTYTTTVNLHIGLHYFTSGVYFFTGGINVAQGATVIAGEGRHAGCANDAQAALNPLAPKNHAITGKGATFILGGNSKLTIDRGGKLRINRRISTVTNRASEGIAIRTVSFGVDTADVTIPLDQVQNADGSIVNANTTTYTASTLAPNDLVIDAEIRDGEFTADGAVIVPNAGVLFEADQSNYALRATNGLIASSLVMDFDAAPTGGANNFSLGFKDVPYGRQVSVVATAAVDSKVFSSSAVFEVQIDKRFAINSWKVDI